MAKPRRQRPLQRTTGEEACDVWCEHELNQRRDVLDDELASGELGEDEYVEKWYTSTREELAIQELGRSFADDGRIVADGKVVEEADFVLEERWMDAEQTMRSTHLVVNGQEMEMHGAEGSRDGNTLSLLTTKNGEAHDLVAWGLTEDEAAGERARVAAERAARLEREATQARIIDSERRGVPDAIRHGPPHMRVVHDDDLKPAPSTGTGTYETLRSAAAKGIETRQARTPVSGVPAEPGKPVRVLNSMEEAAETERLKRAKAFAESPKGRRILAMRTQGDRTI